MAGKDHDTMRDVLNRKAKALRCLASANILFRCLITPAASVVDRGAHGGTDVH